MFFLPHIVNSTSHVDNDVHIIAGGTDPKKLMKLASDNGKYPHQFDGLSKL